MLRRLAITLTALAFAAPAAGAAQLPDDVSRIHSAVGELARAKRGAVAEVAAAKRAAEKALGACENRGSGWARIRAVRDASQRSAYARGARTLWGELREAALEQSALNVYDRFFTRFLSRLEAPFADQVLQAGADAQRARIAYLREAYSFAGCRTFGRLLRKVREYKIGGEHGVAGDYRAGRIHNIFVRYVATRLRRAERRHGGARPEAALQAARTRIAELGGDAGYASYFAFAHSLRG